MQVTQKSLYLWALLCCLFFFNTNLHAQNHPLATDSLAMVQADSLQHVEEMKDSIAKAYVFLDAGRRNPLLDSLRKNIVVEGNDFVRWMKFMDSLRADNAVVKGLGEQKAERPVWVIFVVCLLWVGIGLVRIFYASLFRNIIHAYYDKQALLNLSKEDSMTTSWPYVVLYIIFSLSLALFILIVVSFFESTVVLNISNFFKLSGFVALLFIVKIMAIRLLASIFEIERVGREYVSVLYLMYFNSMLILMPFLLIVTFVPAVYFKIVLIIYMIIVTGLFLYRFFVTAISLLGQLKFSIFYLILYLCTLEIAPILILVKALNN